MAGPPALVIPIKMDLASLAQQTEQAAANVTKTVGNIIRVFNTANNQLEKIGMGVGPMKVLEVGAKGSAAALNQTAAGLGAVGAASKEAAKTIPVLNGVAIAANTAATAATGLGKGLQGVGAVAGTIDKGVSWLGFAKTLLVVVGAAKLLSDAISSTRQQLAEMVDLADKSAKAGVGPKFFQEFTKEADKLKISVADLEAALKHAFDQSKEQPIIDLTEWDFGKEKISETEKLLRVLNTTGEKIDIELFRNAPNQEERVIAVLKLMQQLEQQGRNLEALQVGESWFGKPFADNLRKGETSVTKMLTTMEQAREVGSGIISESLILRAKEVDDKLKAAHNTLLKEWRPVMDNLANTMLDIKETWAKIIELIAEGLKLVNSFDIAVKKDRLEKVQTAISSGESILPGIPRLPETFRFGATETIQQRLIRERDQLQKDIEALEAQGRRPVNIGVVRPPAGPARRKPGAEEGETRDKLQSSVDTIEKRTAALNAETGAIDLGTEARERAKITAELETIAVQLNTAAGEENTAVNEKQRATIDRVAEAWGKAAKAAEDAKGPLRSYMRETANVNKQLEELAVKGLRGLEDALFDIVTGASTAQEAFKKLADAMIADLIRLSIRLAINNALMAVMNSLSGGGAGIISSGAGFVSAKPPMFAEGGFLGAGKWGIAGENGPELIKGPAQVISNADSFGGGPSFNYAPMIDARGADVAAVSKLAQIVARDRMEFESRVKMIVRERPGKRW